MDTILIFFILPLATIILASSLEYLIRCPIVVTAVFFGVWLIVSYLIFTVDIFIIALVLYTILAFLSAIITRIILCNYHKFNINCSVCELNNDVEDSTDDNNSNSCGCSNSRNNMYNIRRRYR